MYTEEQIREIIIKENVRTIKLQFTDMIGTLKSVDVPISQLDSIFENQVMFDGSSIEGFVRIMEADMFLYPDLSTFLILSWDDSKYGRTARFICDVHKPDKTPFLGDPRQNLKRIIKKMNDLGFKDFNVGLEPEFYLFKKDEHGNPTLTPHDNGSYFDLSPIASSDDCRRDIVLELEHLGFEIEASHHEVGPGQNEINFKYANVLETCDNLQTFKLAVKNIAREHNLYASFMPKPIENEAGNGMHSNCSLTDFEGNNVFFDKNDPMQLSSIARHWIAGIMENARALTAVTNPTINSYKRLTPGYEAPCYVAWSTENRSTFIRIPATRGAGTRTEIRSVDPSANPYLAMAAILECGLYGIANKLEAPEPSFQNLFALTRDEREAQGIKNLPSSLYDAMKELKKNEIVKEALGEHIYEKFSIAKSKERAAYNKAISKWEIENYLST